MWPEANRAEVTRGRDYKVRRLIAAQTFTRIWRTCAGRLIQGFQPSQLAATKQGAKERRVMPA